MKSSGERPTTTSGDRRVPAPLASLLPPRPSSASMAPTETKERLSKPKNNSTTTTTKVKVVWEPAIKGQGARAAVIEQAYETQRAVRAQVSDCNSDELH